MGRHEMRSRCFCTEIAVQHVLDNRKRTIVMNLFPFAAETSAVTRQENDNLQSREHEELYTDSRATQRAKHLFLSID